MKKKRKKISVIGFVVTVDRLIASSQAVAYPFIRCIGCEEFHSLSVLKVTRSEVTVHEISAHTRGEEEERDVFL